MIEQQGDWTKITSGSVEGYVKSDLLVFGEEAKHLYKESYGSQGTVTASSLRVRKEPSMDAGQIGSMKQGSRVEILGQEGDWYQVSCGEDSAYMFAEYIQIEETTALSVAEYETQKKEKEQYAAMKKRIKYMYEAGNDSAFETLVTSDDFTDLLSKAEYVQNVHSYDRKQLQEYVETKQQISDLKDSLEKDQKELESKQAEYEKQGDNLNNLITSKSAEVANLDSEIQAAAEAAAREAAERAAREAAAKEAERQQAAASNHNAASTSNRNNTTSNRNNTTSSSTATSNRNNTTSSSSASVATKPSNSSSSTTTSGTNANGGSIVSRAYSQLENFIRESNK